MIGQINGAGFTNRVQCVGYLEVNPPRRFRKPLQVQDYANRDAWRGDEVKLSASTAGEDDRTDDCASGADDVAGPAKIQISTFSDDR